MRSWILAGTTSKNYATPTYGGKLLPYFQMKKKVTNEHYDQYYPRRSTGGPLGLQGCININFTKKRDEEWLSVEITMESIHSRKI